LHAGYLLNGMLNSALQREECKRRGGGGGGEEPKRMESCKTHFFISTEIEFARSEEPFSCKGRIINSDNSSKLTTND